MTNLTDTEATPDFTALYEPYIEIGAGTTPRMTYRPWHAALYLSDEWRCSSTTRTP